MKECLYCGNPVKNKYCNTICQNKHRGVTAKKEMITITKNCEKCSTEFTQTHVKRSKIYIKRFCSNECSNGRTQTEEMNKSRSLKLSKEKEVRKCKCCDNTFEVLPSSKKQFCSISCKNIAIPFSIEDSKKGGLMSSKVQSETRRSKNEIFFANLCIEHFKNVETNKQIFNGWDADVIIHDIKTAVLWNGKWHYEKITESHSVNQVQNRDKIKIGEIKKIGYKPYVIKDMGTHNPDFVREEFDKFLKYIAGN
jgi:hypothetical protein